VRSVAALPPSCSAPLLLEAAEVVVSGAALPVGEPTNVEKPLGVGLPLVEFPLVVVSLVEFPPGAVVLLAALPLLAAAWKASKVLFAVGLTAKTIPV